MERAKQLLKEAGYEDGFEITVTAAIKNTPAEKEACEAVADMWADIGVTAHATSVPYSVTRAKSRPRTIDSAVCHSSGPFADPINLWQYLWNNVPGYSNGFEHPIFIELGNEVLETFDFDERWRLTMELGQLSWDNLANIGLYSQNIVYPLGPKLDPWTEHLDTVDPRRISGLEWAPHRAE